MKEKLTYLLTSRTFYITIGSLIAAGAVLLMLLNWVIMPAITNYDEGVTIPDITGVSLEEAQQHLDRFGLRYEVTDRRSNTAFPADYVIDQTPKPAEIVKPNRKIYLTVNTVVIPTVEVPEVVSLSLRNAEIQLQNDGLQVGMVTHESSRFKNRVLSQSIPAGRTVEKGTVVDLTVSDGLGERMVTIPDILGLSLTQAQVKLRESGLRVDDVVYEPTRDVTPNTVIGYTPKVDELVEGENLQLVVSERFNLEEESESGAVVDTTSSPPDSTQPPDSLRQYDPFQPN